MTSTDTTRTLYGVARKDTIISGGFTHVGSAHVELENRNAQMTELGLEPDLRLVEYDETTTVKTTRPRAYREPTDNDEPDTPIEDTDTPT